MNPRQRVVAFLLIASINTAFADWSKVTTSYQSTSYADLNSIKVNGNMATMDALIDYNKVPFDGNNLPYLSVKMRAEYNCATKQFRTLKLTSYSGHMASGEQPYTSAEPTEWQTVLTKYTQDAFWETACKKK